MSVNITEGRATSCGYKFDVTKGRPKADGVNQDRSDKGMNSCDNLPSCCRSSNLTYKLAC